MHYFDGILSYAIHGETVMGGIQELSTDGDLEIAAFFVFVFFKANLQIQIMYLPSSICFGVKKNLLFVAKQLHKQL